jgi:hypothetical protein
MIGHTFDTLVRQRSWGAPRFVSDGRFGARPA